MALVNQALLRAAFGVYAAGAKAETIKLRTPRELVLSLPKTARALR